MLATRFSGRIETLGSGRLVSNWFIRRSAIRIGETRIRQVMASDELDDFVEGHVEGGAEITLNVGWVMFYRWLLSARTQTDAVRQGLVLFLAGTLTHVVIVGFAGIIAGALAQQVLSPWLGALVGFGVLGWGLATAGLNVKAWLAH